MSALLAGGLAGGLAAAPARAQSGSHAGLVVVHGDGSVVTRCVSFPEESIRGDLLLARSGLDLSIEANSMGTTLCQIDGEGCAYPQQPCFCQCTGTPCLYWSYWQLLDGEWVYSNAGAGSTQVQDGQVDGWRWGIGTVDRAQPPPAISFAEICPEPSQNTALPARLAADPPAPTHPTSPRIAAATPAQTRPQQPTGQTNGLTNGLTAGPALALLLSVLVALPAGALGMLWLRRLLRRGRP
ncbi:MAG: hypothetical protein KGS73_19475 [Chloroflexi bacterium]|nr:hypothetical protein [Chloroflexota bacterium]